MLTYWIEKMANSPALLMALAGSSAVMFVMLTCASIYNFLSIKLKLSPGISGHLKLSLLVTTCTLPFVYFDFFYSQWISPSYLKFFLTVGTLMMALVIFNSIRNPVAIIAPLSLILSSSFGMVYSNFQTEGYLKPLISHYSSELIALDKLNSDSKLEYIKARGIQYENHHSTLKENKIESLSHANSNFKLKLTLKTPEGNMYSNKIEPTRVYRTALLGYLVMQNSALMFWMIIYFSVGLIHNKKTKVGNDVL